MNPVRWDCRTSPEIEQVPAQLGAHTPARFAAHHGFTGALLLACTACLASCGRVDWSHQRAIDAPIARRLVGVWSARFTFDSTLARGAHVAPVTGTIALVQDHFGRVGADQLRNPLHYGVYDVDFNPFGFDSRDAGAVPTAIASAWQAPNHVDSVRIVLDPGETQMDITLDGAMEGDSIGGTWGVRSRFAVGGGTFTMTRVHAPR
jgi:hypothetical protein